MSLTARLPNPLEANRWEPFVRRIRFEGLDLTGATFLAEFRDRKDGGFLRASLATVMDVDDEGITLVSVNNEDVDFGGDIGTVNVPVTTISMRIDEATMEAMDVATEPGDDGSIWWDMQITPSGGDKYRAIESAFMVMAGSSGSGA